MSVILFRETVGATTGGTTTGGGVTTGACPSVGET